MLPCGCELRPGTWTVDLALNLSRLRCRQCVSGPLEPVVLPLAVTLDAETIQNRSPHSRNPEHYSSRVASTPATSSNSTQTWPESVATTESDSGEAASVASLTRPYQTRK